MLFKKICEEGKLGDRSLRIKYLTGEKDNKKAIILKKCRN